MLLSPLLEDGKAEFHAEGMITRSARGSAQQVRSTFQMRAQQGG